METNPKVQAVYEWIKTDDHRAGCGSSQVEPRRPKLEGLSVYMADSMKSEAFPRVIGKRMDKG